VSGVLLPRRFWSTTSVVAGPAGHGVRLDARPLNTPAGKPLEVPTEALAAAIAAEWAAVEERVRPERLPLTRAANVAIDRIAPTPAPVVGAIAAYGETDLLCYRAEAPEGLCRRQDAAWDPWLDWAARSLEARLIPVAGVMHRPQSPQAIARLHAAVAGCDAFRLTALHELVSISGSLVLGLAVLDGALAAERAWDLSRIDEAWQAEQWGEDAEAAATAARHRGDFLQAARLVELVSAQARTS
jgi:chaperone required for assembly of F1-ATPase